LEKATTAIDTSTIEGQIEEKTSYFVNLYEAFVGRLDEFIIGIVAFLIFFAIAKAVRKVVRSAMARTSTEGHVDILVAQIAYIGILTIGVIVALGFSGADLTGLFASLGVAGFAIGFAMKDILGNFLSGIILLIQRPFTIGDYIVVGDVEGTVTNIRVRDTQITTFDGKLVFIPNNAISTSNIINLTGQSERRIDVHVGISYRSDIKEATKVCIDAVSKLPGLVKEPAPDVLVTGFADSSVMLQVRVWVNWKKVDFIYAKSEAHRLVKEALDDAGIEIPFPIRTVYFNQSSNGDPEIEEITGGKSGNKI